MRIAARSVYVDRLEGDANEIEQMSCGHPPNDAAAVGARIMLLMRF